jgi:alkylation response protein AidB-like acyl-CoA dehydrogenase
VDFDESPEEAAFRAEARAWLEDHAPKKGSPDDFSRGYGAASHEAELDYVAKCKAWQHTLLEGGWAGITWPKEYGGRGGTSMQASIFAQEQARYGVSSGLFSVGIGMTGPTLIVHGTEAQKERYLPKLLSGEEVWCQLFSEPGAGSDLAGLRTRAVRDGDEFVVNGQKVWNSGAHVSDFGILLARTNWDVPKHQGITYFVVDMRTPGIEVRPLRQITGAAHFNEVFLTDVRIPKENVVGVVDAGWGVANTTLANERTLIGGSREGRETLPRLMALAREHGLDADPGTRQELARAFTRNEVLRYLGLRVQTAVSQGKQPGPEASIMKVLIGQHLWESSNVGLAMEGAAAMLQGEAAPDDAFWQMELLGHWATRIGGGTDQIQRNVIGERVLGLPREPRADKDVPFSELRA